MDRVYKEQLEKLASSSHHMADWAKRRLEALLARSLEPPPASQEPAVAPEAPPEAKVPVKEVPRGAFGNCFDCQEPFSKRNQRTPFHTGSMVPQCDIIHVCRSCADKRWRELYK